jgi:hypothetical protein
MITNASNAVMVLSNPMNVTLWTIIDESINPSCVCRPGQEMSSIVRVQRSNDWRRAQCSRYKTWTRPWVFNNGNAVVLVVDGFVAASTTAISAASTISTGADRNTPTPHAKPSERTCFPFHLRRCLESRSIKSSDFKDDDDAHSSKMTMMPIHPPRLHPLLSRDTEPTPHSFIVASRTRVDYSQAPRIR